MGEALAAARALTSEAPRVRHETIRRVINAMVHDVIVESRARLAALAPADVEAIRDAGPVVGFSVAMAETNRAVKGFLFARMYRHPEVNRVRNKADATVRALFGAYLAHQALHALAVYHMALATQEHHHAATAIERPVRVFLVDQPAQQQILRAIVLSCIDNSSIHDIKVRN